MGAGAGVGVRVEVGFGVTRVGEVALQPREHAGRHEAVEGVQQRLVTRHLVRVRVRMRIAARKGQG